MTHDILAHSPKVFLNIQIRISQNSITVSCKIVISLRITLFTLFGKMLGTIQLNNQFCIRNIKICYIVIQYLLPLDCDIQFFQKIIPKMLFFFGHVFAQILRLSGQILIIPSVHQNTSSVRLRLTPSPQGEGFHNLYTTFPVIQLVRYSLGTRFDTAQSTS